MGEGWNYCSIVASGG